MTIVQEKKIAEACSILFGEEFTVEKDTLDYLQLSGIKHAYRARAKTLHPDIAASESRSAAEENFLRLKKAYDFLISVKSLPSAGTVRSSAGRPAKIPDRRLRLGEYLYYTGKISWNQLIAAINWQHELDDDKNGNVRIGNYFLRYGIINAAELGFSVFKLSVHNSNY